MPRIAFLAALLAASSAGFAQTTTVSPGSSLGSSGSTLGAPGTTIGSQPSTPGVTTGSPTIPSTGAFNRPGDTTLPGSATTPGLSTLPGLTEREREERDRERSSVGASRAPRSPGLDTRPACIPGSAVNPC